MQSGIFRVSLVPVLQTYGNIKYILTSNNQFIVARDGPPCTAFVPKLHIFLDGKSFIPIRHWSTQPAEIGGPVMIPIHYSVFPLSNREETKLMCSMEKVVVFYEIPIKEERF